MNRFLKNALISIGVIVISIFAYLLISKLGLFNSRLAFNKTSIALERIREVNQLLGAEYHGEVISDLKQVYEGYHEDDKTIKYGIDSLYKKYRAGYLLSLEDSINLKVLKGALDEDNVSIDAFIDIRRLGRYRKATTDRFLRREIKIAIIGTGVVRAGIDLDSLKEENISINSSDNSIEITVPKSMILSTNINPWYDYEREIPGFTIVHVESESKVTFDEVIAVKSLCKFMLEKEALEKDLLMRSDSSAKRTLVNLFSILGFDSVDVRFSDDNPLENT